eukprot:CAMPEP_0119105802 /NCGR_PEP_ID=MMETSP1180-20130426/3661_1 /TAXON_ID=3052 ORGANISM="Chlamydomonas cf sp, Strain CCMP681" /NCGR_SAMPLE_ID=MMETSP1180 /ASSEMBLY_ACC=CAM_ASM_000741 /LENGTH=255 /DNA_ID=CAMNT_0007090951 /DNA_START=17 /DNA_END=784 /DNA_ORIENTATION=-
MQSAGAHSVVSGQARLGIPFRAQQRQRPCVRVRASAQKPGSETDQLREQAVKLGAGAKVKLKELAEKAQDSASRTWRRLDSEYEIKSKAEKLIKRAQEKARDIDQEYQLRRKLRSSSQYVQRMYPIWSKQLDAFSQQWYGKAAILLVLFVIISSQLFWSALNFLLLLWWLAIPLGAAFLKAAQKKAQERAASEAEERERQSNPFADMFRPRTTTSSSSTSKESGKGGYRAYEGPILDAEYTVIKPDPGASSKDKK